jgi:hypothetical protein
LVPRPFLAGVFKIKKSKNKNFTTYKTIFMAILKGDFPQNLSGSFGKQVVFRRRNNKTYACKHPGKRKKQVLSAREVENRRWFLRAVGYAQKAKKNPLVMAAYQAVAKPGQTAYKVAFKDAYTIPQILLVDTSGYSGNINEGVLVKAIDDFKVMGVKLSIYSPDGSLIEEGEAQPSEDGLDWIYTTRIANPQCAGSTIHATARDLPGNWSIVRQTVL